MTIQKNTEQYFPVVLFITLYKVVPTFEPVDESLKVKANEQYFPRRSIVYCAEQRGSNFRVCGCWIHLKTIEKYLPIYGIACSVSAVTVLKKEIALGA